MKSFVTLMQGDKHQDNRIKIVICLLLTVITFSVYQQVLTHDFINLDDESYITNNSRVGNGLSADNIIWAFSTTYFFNWHPLTWLSYFLDSHLFGVNPSAFHLVNVLIHIANTLLLFLFLNQATERPLRSALVAALFALHPLHVESVAWVSERKDVLSAFFGFLAMGSYLSYAKSPKISSYLIVLLFFALSLMAKPMLVTLPFVLLLLDYWPLKRFNSSALTGTSSVSVSFDSDRLPESSASFQKSTMILIGEKTPFFLIAIASAVITIIAQNNSGSIASLDRFPLGLRLANALLSYVFYLLKMIWPQQLSIYYPFPPEIPLWQSIASANILILISCLVLKYRSRFPYLLVGWLWYLGTLIPVIGIVQVGSQSMADRYTYIPLIGPFIMLVWLAFDMTVSKPVRKVFFSFFTTGMMLSLIAMSSLQVGYWKNSVTVFGHALEIDSKNAVAHLNYGVALNRIGLFKEVINHYKDAIRLAPKWALLYNNLGLAYSELGQLEKALICFEHADGITPNGPSVVKHYKRVKKMLAEKMDVISKLENQAQNEPMNIDLQIELGNLYQQIYKVEESINHFQHALTINAGNSEAHKGMAMVLTMTGQYQEAEAHLKRVIDTNPHSAEACYLMASLYASQKKTEMTINWLRKSIEMGFNDWNRLRKDQNYNFIKNRPDFKRLLPIPA